MKVTLYAFRLTIARSLKIAVRARLSSQQIRITLPSGNMSLVYNSLNTNMSTVYSKVGAGVPNSGGFRTLVISYFFFETIPLLLLVGLQVEATTSNRTAYF